MHGLYHQSTQTQKQDEALFEDTGPVVEAPISIDRSWAKLQSLQGDLFEFQSSRSRHMPHHDLEECTVCSVGMFACTGHLTQWIPPCGVV